MAYVIYNNVKILWEMSSIHIYMQLYRIPFLMHLFSNKILLVNEDKTTDKIGE